ncbi:voltage-dependent anion channel [Phyllosticta capitalensis]
MATGMVGLILHAFPYTNSAVPVIYTILFIINIITFIAITILTILRYALFPKTWGAMLRHPMQSLFLGCCPMGLTTLINNFIFVCIEDAGWTSPWAPYFAWALWWIDVVMAVACSCGLPFLMMYVHPSTNLSAMTAVWLLPAATPIVTASNGAAVASVLPNQSHAMITLLTSYVLWGIGFPMALLTLAIYFHRLAMHKLPPREMIITVFMPLGPIGQAAYTIMNLGKESLTLFPKTGSLHALAGDVLYIMGFGFALILWGFGLVWTFFAVASVTRSRFPFNMGWWGFTFPTGVYVLATLQLGAELPSAFFNILGMIMGIITILIWFLVTAVTIRKNLLGQVSFATCLQQPEVLRRWRKGHNNDKV